MASTGFRNSQLRLLRTCEFAYHQQYVLNIPGRPSPALLGGQRIHAAAAEFVRRLLADEALDVHEIAFRVVRGHGVEYADALRVLTRLQEAIGIEWEVNPAGVILLEDRLEMPLTLHDGTEVTFFGTPDLVERTGRRTCRITDYKSHWKPESAEEFQADPQLRRYALLVHHHFPAMEEFELEKRFIRYENNSHQETVTADDLPGIQRALASEIQAARAIEARGEFEATGGSFCSVCPHHHTCPLIRELDLAGVMGVAISDDAEAAALAGRVIALEAAAASVKDNLKTYLGSEHATGQVSVPGGTYGYGPTNQREISVPDLRAAMAEANLEAPDDVLRVDMKELDYLLDRLPESAAQPVRAAVQTSQGAQCRFRRGPATKTTAATAATQGELL